MSRLDNQLFALESLTGNSSKTVKKCDYENFCKEFIFEKLRGKKFGEAFCQKFDFNDLSLKNLSDQTAKFHIEKFGYIE
jgi:hypothetical protein